jgi:hypothetical protein
MCSSSNYLLQRGKKAGSLINRNAQIARIKTAVIDGAVTLTGSYNWTSAFLTIPKTFCGHIYGNAANGFSKVLVYHAFSDIGGGR